MTTLAALVSGFGWHVADLLRAAEALDVALHAVPFPEVSATVGQGRQTIEAGGVELTQVDGVLVRMMPPGSLEQVVFRMDALHRVCAAGVRVWNPPRAVEVAVDKYLTLALLDQAGVPVPATWTGQSATAALDAFEALGGDVVIKPLFGSEGRGIVRVSDRELTWRTCHAIERMGAVLYLQRMIRHPATTCACSCCKAGFSLRCGGMHLSESGALTCRRERGPSPAGLTRRQSAGAGRCQGTRCRARGG